MLEEKFKIAEKFYKNADYETALKLYLELEKDYPKKYALYVSIGNTYDHLGNKENALLFYTKAHKTNKDRPTPLCNAAIVYYEMGDYKNSLKFVNKTLDVDSKNVSAWIIKGNVHYQENDYAKALESYTEAFNLNNTYYTAVINLANTYVEMKEYNLALKFALKAAEINPSVSTPYSVLGNIFKELEELDKAVENLMKAVTINPNDAWSYNYLSQVYQKKNDYAKALEYGYEAVLKSNETDNSQHINFGYVLYEILEYAKDLCKEYAKRWLKDYPENMIAKHMANAVLNDGATSRANDEYLVNVFDIFAADFETVLDNLDYRAPQLVGQLLDELSQEKKLKKSKILDLGCGTGLCAKYLKKYSKIFSLHGVDISENMLKEAKKKKLYNKLFLSEIEVFLAGKTTSYDLMSSADVFTYFGDLESVFYKINQSLKPHGRIVFTVSENTKSEGIFFHPSGRFLHSEKYVRTMLKKTGFYVERLNREYLRSEGDKEVWGFIVSAVKYDSHENF